MEQKDYSGTYIDEERGRLLMVSDDITHNSPNKAMQYVLTNLESKTSSVEMSEQDMQHLTKMWKKHNFIIEPTKPGRPSKHSKAEKPTPQLLTVGEQTTPEKLRKIFTDDFLRHRGMAPMLDDFIGYFACKESKSATPIVVVEATDVVEYKGDRQWQFVKHGKPEAGSDVSKDKASEKAEEHDSDGAVQS